MASETISIYNKQGNTLLHSGSYTQTKSISYILAQSWNTYGVTEVSYSIGGNAISGGTVVDNLQSTTLYDVSPAEPETITGFYLDGNKYQFAGGVSMSTITVTLTAAGWSNKEQTVSATGVTASNTIIVSPAPASINDYASNSIYASAQGSGTLTFKTNTVPSGDISVNVLILS